MNIYVACAEHDESCPDAWQLVAYSLFVRNMINHALTAHALPYSTYPFFCEFYLYHLQLSKKTFIFVTKFHHHIILYHIILCSLSPLPRWHHPRNTKRTSPYHLPENTSPIQTIRPMIKL